MIVHGTAHEIDPGAERNRGFREYCLGVYGEDWDEWAARAPYARIDPRKMFTYRR